MKSPIRAAEKPNLDFGILPQGLKPQQILGVLRHDQGRALTHCCRGMKKARSRAGLKSNGGELQVLLGPLIDAVKGDLDVLD